MNYRKVYMSIINSALLQNRKKNRETYYEKHHILPKSLFPRWKNSKSNIVLLTAREHLFCHKLLVHIYPLKQMYYALWRLTNDNKGHKINPKDYEKLRKNISILQSENGSFPCSEEKNKFLSIRNSGTGNPMYNRSAYREMDEQDKLKYSTKMSNSCKKVNHSEEWSKNISSALKGKQKSQKHKQLMLDTLSKNRAQAVKNAAEAKKGKHWYTNGVINILEFNCPEGFLSGRSKRMKT